MRRAGPALTAGYWTDLSYASGIPVANFYASTPMVSATLSPNDGIYAGPSVNSSGYRKYFHKALFMPPATSIGQATLHIHDIVAYYPFVDGDGGSQDMTNVLSSVRYGGAGCMLMVVSQGAGYANATDVTITYVDKDDQTKTINPLFLFSMASAGQLASQQYDALSMNGSYTMGGPYIQLPTGIKSITNINFPTGIGGIFAFCIVKVIDTISLQEIGTPIEMDCIRDSFTLKEIEDGAYVSMVIRSSVSATPTTAHAELSFIWG
jgi:hypothetical protein